MPVVYPREIFSTHVRVQGRGLVRCEIRHLERLEQLQPRLFTAMTGGAAGAFAALGEVGPAVQDSVAKRLGLTPMAVPSRSIVDHFTLSGGLISAEAVMMTLGTTIGRQD